LVFKPSRFVGDSVVLTSSFALDTSWVKGRINVTAIVQDTATKTIVQAARQVIIEPKAVVIPTGISATPNSKTLIIYPNPAHEKVFFSDGDKKRVTIFNVNGSLIKTEEVTDELEVNNLPNGLYILKIRAFDGNEDFRKLVIAN
jgi:hypothetical protein